MAAARIYRQRQMRRWPSIGSMAFWAGLALLPDIDVIGLRLGIDYRSQWGHRGATHSFVFAVAVAIVAGLLARSRRLPALQTAIAAGLVVVSHPLLDTLTSGGLGCALLWPFDHTRYFGPWRVIPVAPIGLDIFSAYGVFVAMFETVFFGPVWIYALWPRPD